ncbi:MAG TPA: LytTR family DNA-binding domain-containing protein [Rhodothermales bacterium]|nr:LytTR family DNA-binding domain-containing protein [Rhodothermales bacterium]
MEERIRTLVVEDEPLARNGVIALLGRDPDVVVVGACADGAEAAASIEALRPDLVLLDVQLPELTGLDVLARIGAERMPAVIFITAYDQYAVAAFDANAVDYLVKPFTDERFFRALDRAKRTLQSDEVRTLSARLSRLLHRFPTASPGPAERAPETAPEPHPAPPEGPVARLMVRAAGRLVFVPVEDVVWIEAQGAYARVRLAGKAYLLRQTLGEVAATLDPAHFVRTHRSAVVNLDCVQEIITKERGRHLLRLANGDMVALSRRRKEAVERLLRGRSRSL